MKKVDFKVAEEFASKQNLSSQPLSSTIPLMARQDWLLW